jgi:O-antigen ligase
MPSYPERPPQPKANIVQAFRGEVRVAVPLHPLEYALVVIVALHLCLLPWVMGARAPWAQVGSLVFAFIGFIIALWPRKYTGDLAPAGSFVLHPWSRLPKFPLFWLGLLFFAYVICQALNPAWERFSTGTVWFLKSKEHIDWLPTSIEAPFARMNAWRMLTIWGGAWLVVCALWMGLTRRISAHGIIIPVIINAAVIGFIAILQKMTGATKMLWFIDVPAAYFHGTFVYKNHAGAYFNLMIALTAGLLVWNHVRALRRLDRSSPAPVFAFGVILLSAVVFMSGSRTAMLLLAAYTVISFGIYIIWRARTQAVGQSNTFVSVFLALGCGAFIATAAYFLNLDQSIDQIKNAFNEGSKAAIDSRIQARDATYNLFRDEPLTGWGAGSFRHAFPIHQQNYPEIFRVNGRIMSWDHAHNDYVQFIAEMGIIGALFPLLALGWVIVKLCRLNALSHPAFLVLIVGITLSLAHAWVDFPLYNCAIFTIFCAAWTLTLRWAELETNR